MDSKCIPKDVLAWNAWAESVGYTPAVTQAILEKNESWTGKANNPNALSSDTLKAA
jgi:UDP-glucose 6-dehydrogenase